jgi:hypothetical protein
MHKLLTFFGLVLSFQIFGQFDRPIKPTALKEDFSIYKESLEEAHPGLYWYRTKREIDSIFTATEDKLNKPLSERAFFTLLSSTTAKIGCLHTNLRVSSKFEEKNINVDAQPFPFEVKLDSNRIFIYQNLSSDTTILKGDEIITINDKEANTLIPFLADKISNDGYGENWSRYALERSFRYYYHVFFGQPENFKLKLRDQNGA